MKRTNIYLSDQQLAALQALGDHRGQPMSELIRQAIDEWLGDQGVQILDEDSWTRRFDELLARRRTVAQSRSPSQAAVNDDVASAVREVRRNRTARRR